MHSIGQLQCPTIGMVASPGSGGPLGIGIGIPLISTPQIPQQAQLQMSPHIVMPDSSEDRLLRQSAQSGENSLLAQNNSNWSLLHPMGFSFMSLSQPPLLSDPNMCYGINLINLQSKSDTNSGSPEAILSPSPSGKEIVHCKFSTLFPPTEPLSAHPTREKPPGCKTIFVGGLPENATETHVRDVFERCGEIHIVRMSNKKFCHLRFLSEESVERGIYLSGYRMRIGSNSDASNIGRLHVDYAQARNDLFEWECRQRQLSRERRHRDRVERERKKQGSPTPPTHYSEHEATSLSDKIKCEDSFMKAIHILVAWLERGDCNKKNVSVFYSMVQSTNAHMRRMLAEKFQYEEELRKSTELAKQRMQDLLAQFGEIEKVFQAASHKKVWDHFTKAQRKNIENWKKQAVGMHNFEIPIQVSNEPDMEFSDPDDNEEICESSFITTCNTHTSPSKKRRINFIETSKISSSEENSSLSIHIQGYKDDLSTELNRKDKIIKMLQEQLDTMQRYSPEVESKCDSSTNTSFVKSSQKSGEERNVEENETQLAALISILLNAHPMGAPEEYILSYAQNFIPAPLSQELISKILFKFPMLFKKLERKWIFNGFFSINNNANSDVK